jgi:hypothetical protein
MHRLLSISLLVVIAVLVALPATAQLNGHNLRGDYGLSAGSQPPPGIWVGLLYPNIDIDTLRDRDGNEIPSDFDIDYHAVAPWLWWVSNTKILGGNYSIFVAPVWSNSALEAPVLGIDSEAGTGFGDLYVQPIVLGWHKERADYLAGLGVYAPVGRYEADGDDNIGLGMWSYEAFGGATFYLNQAKTWNLAAIAFYETHSSKDGSDQKVGDIVTLEGGLGRSFAEGAINVGLAYFGQWKVTDDDLGLAFTLPSDSPFDLPDLHRHQILGAGPEVTLPLATKKKFYGSVTLRYFWDFSVESNAGAQTFIFNLSMPVPFISLTEE